MRAASTFSLVSPRANHRARRSGETSRSAVPAGRPVLWSSRRTRWAKLGSREAKKTSRAYVTSVSGAIHQAWVAAKNTPPITSTITFRGRRAAARVTRLRSAGERGAGLSGTSRRSGSIVHATPCQGRDTDRRAGLEPKRVGGVAFVYGEAEAPVRVRDEHQLPRLGR